MSTNDRFDEIFPGEEEMLNLIRRWMDNCPKPTVWFGHPINYPRAMRSVERILEVIHKESPEAEHEIVFDELMGTSLCLKVKAWTYSFCGCQDFAEAISLADSVDIDASSEGEVWLYFGFRKARVPVFLKEKDSPND